MDDLRSKLPPDLQGKIFDMKDMDLDSLKAKLDSMKLEKQGRLCLCQQMITACVALCLMWQCCATVKPAILLHSPAALCPKLWLKQAF